MKNLQIARPDEEGKLSYGLFNEHGGSSYVAGNPAVEQLVAKILLTDAGTDLFAPASGGSLRLKMIGEVTPTNLRSRISAIGQAIMQVESEIKGSQSGEALPASERLRSIDIELIDYDFVLYLWILKLHLRMEDGNVGRIMLR